MAMTVEGAMAKIQKAIDKPGIQPVKKRQLFGLYQSIRNATRLTPELEKTIDELCRDN